MPTLNTTSSSQSIGDRLSIPRPTVTAGQLLVALIANRHHTGFNPVITATSHAWTEVTRFEPGTLERPILWLLTRVADASDTSAGNWTFDFTLPGTSGNPMGTVFVIDAAAESDVTVFETGEGNSTAPAASAMTVETDNSLALFCAAGRSPGSAGHTPPTGFTEVYDVDAEILFASAHGLVDAPSVTPTATLTTALEWAALVALVAVPLGGGWTVGAIAFGIPTPSTGVLTEAGDFLVTESGDYIVQE